MQGEHFYTVEEAAHALKLTPDRIRQMLRDGEIEGVPPEAGGAPGWKIPVRVVRGRDRPPPVDLSESSTTGSESPSSSEEVSDSGDIRGEEEPGSTPTQPERDDDAVDDREPAASSAHRITVQEAAHILETSVDALLEAKDEVISDLRERVAFLEQQLEGRAEEIRRRDHIIAALTERLPPALETPEREKQPGAPESTADEPTGVAPQGAGGFQAGSDRPRDTARFPVRGSLLRPWWDRVFKR